ncbi:hypothetical protein LTS18_009777 [Coniosporium uncinatum]|uniref:Uncharacterized protein n=1 Tax=Coniosporium uncinatum TaxID=93489 RepID=A0ACC3DAB8_9PEZI|nr:hypothetical protein LTS18_009777 [Coniosporium uncinatum]
MGNLPHPSHDNLPSLQYLLHRVDNPYTRVARSDIEIIDIQDFPPSLEPIASGGSLDYPSSTSSHSRHDDVFTSHEDPTTHPTSVHTGQRSYHDKRDTGTASENWSTQVIHNSSSESDRVKFEAVALYGVGGKYPGVPHKPLARRRRPRSEVIVYKDRYEDRYRHRHDFHRGSVPMQQASTDSASTSELLSSLRKLIVVIFLVLIAASLIVTGIFTSFSCKLKHDQVKLVVFGSVQASIVSTVGAMLAYRRTLLETLLAALILEVVVNQAMSLNVATFCPR